jgi:hypothetical protein
MRSKKMGDDSKKIKNGRRPKKIQIEDNLKENENGRRPQYLKKTRIMTLQKMGDNLKRIRKMEDDLKRLNARRPPKQLIGFDIKVN